MLTKRFKISAVIFTFSIWCCIPVLVLGQPEIDPGNQATTLKTSSINFKDATYQPTPLYTITKGEEELLMAGVEIAATYIPYSKGVIVAIKMEKFAFEVAKESVDERNRLVNSDLIVIDNKASALKEMIDNGEGIQNNPKALQLYKELKSRSMEVDGSGSFFLKAITKNSLYSIVKQGGYVFLKEFLGSTFTKWLGNKRILRKGFLKLNKIGLGRIKLGLSHTKWQQLKKLGDLAEDISKKMLKSLSKYLIIKKLKNLEEENSNVLESLYEKIIGEHPAYYSYTSTDIRLITAAAPQAALPVFAEIPPQYLNVVMPAQIAVYKDPVCNTTNVQNEIIATQPQEQSTTNNNVQVTNTTTNNYPISNFRAPTMPSWVVPTANALGRQ